MWRLAILTSHPIQYHAAWFAGLAAHSAIDLEVMYCHQATAREQADAGFGVEFEWDLPLLNGYKHWFLHNVAVTPSLHAFSGLDTPEIAGLIGRNRYDAVIVNGWHYKSAWQAIRACWKTKTPVMVRSDSNLHTARSLLKQVAKRPFYSWFIPKLDACLPVGQWSRDYFLHYGARADRVFIVPHVVDVNYFAGESLRLDAQRAALRSQWGLKPAAVVYLFAGKFIDAKRPMDFVQSVAAAAERDTRVAGLMVGDGPLRAACQEFASSNGAPIKFAGFVNQSQMATTYVAADALVLPSESETWGLVVNEAMACGRPCLVSDRVGCGPDLIIPDKTGAVFPVGDCEALSTLMVKYAANSHALVALGQQARARAEEYTVAAAVARVLPALAAVKLAI